MNLFGCRKAQAQNYLAVSLFLLVFGFLSILGYMIYTEFVTAFTTTGYYTGITQQTGERIFLALQLYDYAIILIMAVMLVAVGITSYRLRTHPMFFIITVVTGIFTGFVSYFFNYVFIQLVSDPLFNAARAFFPRTMLICTNLHWITLVALIIGSIALYGKKGTTDFVNDGK